MAQQPAPTIQNHFIAGLKTEFTGLNFPDNAATDAQNCVFSLLGDVTRRGGINYEANNTYHPISTIAQARSSFRWLNAGGDGESQILVKQVGAGLYFYLSSAATPSAPLSTTLILNQTGSPFLVDMTLFIPNPNPNFSHTQLAQQIQNQECQYAYGNGYLFVYHPQLDPFYCTYIGGQVAAQKINLQIRDTGGIIESQSDNFRPATLTPEHQYNLTNQGWTTGSGWNATCDINVPYNSGLFGIGGVYNMPIISQSNTNTLINGDLVQVTVPQAAIIGVNNNNVNFTATFTASVSGYTGPGSNNITLTVQSISWAFVPGQVGAAPGFWTGGNFISLPQQQVSLQLINIGFINAWFNTVNNYPSNCDIWWLYKDTNDNFNPSATFNQVQSNLGRAPRGSYIFSPFNQDRTAASGIVGLTPIVTNARPATGAFFAGRVWYAGINASFPPTGDMPFTTWTETLYFSQLIENTDNFGRCYQSNDPTSQDIFEILPTDGGYVSIQGCGAILKLFPLRFGLLVFCANGIWYISGSQGIGFTATDYTVTKISTIRSISGTSYIDVQGYPMFWNEEGVYQVVPSQQAGSAHSPDIQLDVTNLALGTILTFYTSIPSISKQYARGDYDYLNYIVQWCFRSEAETNIGNRYIYDTILNYNVITKAFYLYSLPPNSISTIADVKYIQQPGDLLNASPPLFKYLTALNDLYDTFSEENDFTRYVDFFNEPILQGITIQDLVGLGSTAPSFVSGSSPATHTGVFTGYDYSSYFVAGYVLPSQGLRKIQTPYVYIFSRNNGFNMYGVRAIWDFAGKPTLGTRDGNSGRWTTRQVMVDNSTDYTMTYKKVRLRGRGLAVQLRIDSASGQPFDIMGWSVWNEVNTGI